MNEPDARYPIGRLQAEGPLTPERRAQLIAEIESLPRMLGEALDEMREDEWERRYREGGWTIRQVVHHVADSHVNMYCRVRLTLTEELPTIKPYQEALWADLPDVLLAPPAVSLGLLEAVHARTAALLRALPPEAFSRQFVHPEGNRKVDLDQVLVTYAWHGRHHAAHIRQARSSHT